MKLINKMSDAPDDFLTRRRLRYLKMQMDPFVISLVIFTADLRSIDMTNEHFAIDAPRPTFILAQEVVHPA
jgi:hypothetical protein